MSQPLEAFRNSFKIPELKQRILFALVMLAIYRLGAHVPTPGVDGGALAEKLASAGGLLGFYDLFSGGAFAKATVFALGIMPYISASIIMQLLTAVIPALEKLAKEGQEGRKKINDYTRYATVGLCVVQSIGVGMFLQNQGRDIVATPGLGFILMCVISFTTGTAFIMWLGEQISEHGVGNGISLIIFVSIVSRMPAALTSMVRLINAGELNVIQAGILITLMVFVVAGVILVTTGQRRVPVQYPRQVKGRRVLQGSRNYLPLRVNMAGVIPIIFASSILMLPGMVVQWINVEGVGTFFEIWFRWNGPMYNVVYAGMIVFFTYFYTAIIFNPVEMADNMKKYGGVIMGVRPGKATAEYLNAVMTRITIVGALFLAGVALLPNVVYSFLKVHNMTISSFFGGTSLLILVGVALDTVQQIEQHLVMRNYEGFTRGRRIRTRR